MTVRPFSRKNRLLNVHACVADFSSLCDNSELYLFYCGQVYFNLMESRITLPRSRFGYPIWTLIDVDFQDREPPYAITGRKHVWPIQTSSPNPARWKHWSERNEAAILGMPLWSMEELVKGYVFNLFPLPVTCRSIGVRHRLTLAFATVYVIDPDMIPSDAD